MNLGGKDKSHLDSSGRLKSTLQVNRKGMTMTFSVMGLCEKTGKIGWARTTVSTRPTNKSFAPIGLNPYTNHGALIIPQAFWHPTMGYQVAKLLSAGHSFADLKPLLEEFDSNFSYRQLGILKVSGEVFVHTGKNTAPYSGHVIGKGFLVMANCMSSEKPIKAMAEAYEKSEGEDLDERLMLAIEAGRDAGGQADRQGNHLPELSAILRVYAKDPAEELDFRVDFDIAAVAKLRRLLMHLKPLGSYYRLMFEDPQKYIQEPRYPMEIFRKQI
jgi:uncharacterized Ntn-hydrolase superfamily protein